MTQSDSQSDFKFPVKMRLSGRLEFARVFEGRCRKSSGPISLMVRPNDQSFNRLGLSVGRRVGTAVKRHRIKRLLREAFRLSQHEQPVAYDVVVVVHPHETLAMSAYQQHLLDALRQADQVWQKRYARRQPQQPTQTDQAHGTDGDG